MRIISDFRDYYDSVQGQGQDLDLQYLRMRKEIPLVGGFPSLSSGIRYSYGGPRISLDVVDRVIGFCGKVYGVVRLATNDPTASPDPYGYCNKKIVVYCYNMEAVDAFMEKHFKPKQLEQYHRPVHWKVASRGGRKWPSDWARKEFQRFFDQMEEARDQHADRFLKHHCPIFVNTKPLSWKEKPKLILNPNLKEYEFFRLFDHYQTFQEIQMFLGGMASPEKPIPPVSDADMVVCKGFDPKFSFRKDPGKKKRSRKNKNKNKKS